MIAAGFVRGEKMRSGDQAKYLGGKKAPGARRKNLTIGLMTEYAPLNNMLRK
jgi:hypothetical protein